MTDTSLIAHRYATEMLAETENQLRSGIADPEDWLVEALGGSQSSSGVRVNVESVLGLPAAWRSIDLVSATLAKMPVEVQRKKANKGWEDIPDHPVERLLNRWCSGLYTTFALRQTMQIHALLEGNGRAYIDRDNAGIPLSLTIMMPNQTYTIVINGQKYHVVFFQKDQYGDVLTDEVQASMESASRGEYSSGTGGFYTIPDSSVLHIPGLSYNAPWGLPLIAIARDTFGNNQSAQDAVSYQFSNGGRPGLLLTAPRGLFPTEKQAREFMVQFRAKHEGVANAGKTGLLREGMTAETVAAQNTFTGLSDLTGASKSDIALLFGTEYLLGEISAVYKDLQSRMTAFYQNTLDKWAETWEQEAGRKLLVRQRYLNGSLRVHLDPTAILRGTPNELADYTGKLRTQGLINGDEGRKYHNLPPAGLTDDYGNPAISAPGMEDESEPAAEEAAEEDEAPNQNAENRGQRAVARHFTRMLDFERRRLIECSEEEGGFMAQVAEFYTGFEENLTDLCEDLLIDPAIAENHCDESRGAILDVAGCVGAQQLPTVVKTLTLDWEIRYEKFTNV
jgi:HK97 family phage portal protein